MFLDKLGYVLFNHLSLKSTFYIFSIQTQLFVLQIKSYKR